jgi:hypothetical protein
VGFLLPAQTPAGVGDNALYFPPYAADHSRAPRFRRNHAAPLRARVARISG